MKKGCVYVNFEEPRTKNQEPRTKNQEPRTKNQEPRTKRKLGFTLSELLVSLAVLGLIAGLTVPNVVASVQKTKTKAMGKSLIQATAEVFRTAYLTGELEAALPPTVGDHYFNSKNHPLVQLAIQKMNPTTVCDSNQVSDACTPPDGDYYFRTNPKLIFADGSILTVHGYNSDLGALTLFVDYNGFKAGPNLTWAQRQEAGNASLSDRNYLMVNLSDSTVSGGGFDCKPGMLCPAAAWYPHTLPIWNALFNS